MIKWPDRYSPDSTRVHVHNVIDITAPAETVWAWLIRAKLWPTWYKNSSNVVIEGGAQELSIGARFKWRTFGVNLQSEVIEFQPSERLAWNAKSSGIDAYHAWLIEKTPSGCHVVTEENQNGWLAALSNSLRPKNMSSGHQIWLEQLCVKAKSGMPPS